MTTIDSPSRSFPKAALLAAGGLSLFISVLSIPYLRYQMEQDETFLALLKTPIWLFAVGFGLLVSFAAIAWFPPRWWNGALAVLSSAVPLHASVILAWPTVRTNTAWLHAGFSDYLGTGGVPDGAYDLRFNWPAGYEFMAQAAQAIGVSTLNLALVWPLVTVPLGAGMVALLAHALGARPRGSIIAAWLFVVTSWVGQDYMSPQSMTFLLFLGAVSLMVSWLRGGLPQSKGMWAAFSVLVIAITVTHQFTLIVLFVTTVVLFAFQRRRLLLVAAGIEALCAGVYRLLFTDLTDSQWAQVTTGLGNPFYSFTSGVSARVNRGDIDPFRLFVVADRIVLTGIIIGGSVLLWWWLRRKRHMQDALPIAIMVGAGITGLLLPYGGESVLRISLFAFPAALSIWAIWLDGLRQPGRWLMLVGLCATLMFVPARFGNDVFERFSQGQVEAVEFARYVTAPEDRIIIIDVAMPIQDRDIMGRDFRMIAPLDLVNPDELERILQDGPTGQGVIINSRQAAIARTFNRGVEPGLYEAISLVLSSDSRFVLLGKFPNGNEVWGLVGGTPQTVAMEVSP